MPRPAADPAPLGLRERKKQETHARILETARELFEEKGFESTTVDEICARANVSPKTFFNYFATKQTVVREIAEAFLDDLGSLVEEARKQNGSTAARLAHLFGRAGERALRAGPRHKELLVEVVRVAQMDDLGPLHSRRLHAAFEALLEEGATTDLSPDHDVAFLTEMVVGAFITILLNWQSVEDYPLRDHLEEAARFLGRAVTRADR
jgi:AcrR family transcriptional regulator